MSDRGTFVVARENARAFADALRAAGLYRFSEPNREFKVQQTPPAPVDEFTATDWRAFLIPAGLTPPPVEQAPLTAVIDSAVDVTHPDLAGVRVMGDPTVTDVHGTAVTSVVAGRANGVGMVGVYPGAPVLAIGTSLDSATLARAIATAVDAGAKVLNLSFGGPSPSYAMFVELAYAASRGVLPVAAAGNDYETVTSDGTANPVMFPAAFPHVLSVASMGPSGASSSFSTANGAVDIAAPGESVLTAVPPAFDTDGVPDGYQRLDGTSFASPAVAGAAAWLLAARPGLDGGQLADLLRWNATDIDVKGWDADSGYGLLNLPAALTAEEPYSDTQEVNDDVEWVDGTRFDRADPYIFRTFSRTKSLSASVDAWKDPADVYRVELAGHGRVEIVVRTARDADPDLAFYGSRASSIYKRKGLVSVSTRGVGKRERVVVENRGSRKTVGYVAVYAPRFDADRLDAPYALTVRRLRK
ncbi:S8 family peptidase [Solirubrobacter soli]|uniref:S8 family peptidase n=1 Tax=Solirubrobacter soli TaxID=363832 RepID=UPI0012F90982|nr:S8 family serine peptidase [Solirubrobacter soli]